MSMNNWEGVRRSEGFATYNHRLRVAVVLVKAEETKEGAWHRYLREHPEYTKNDVRIFHFANQRLYEDYAPRSIEHLAGRREDGVKRNFAGRCEGTD
jgi:hypothetical protein